MGGKKKWLSEHVKFCFNKFTADENEEGKWCIVGTDSNGDPVLVVPNATRNSSDPVKEWYDIARAEDVALFSTINLQCWRTNLKNAAQKWFDGAHNPANGSNPPRTTDHINATHEQEGEDGKDDKGDEDGDDVPDLPNYVAKPAEDADNLYDGQGNENEAPFNYVQAQFITSSTTSSQSGNIRSTEKCHVIVHAPSGWKLSDQDRSSFCTLSANGSTLTLKFKPPRAVFDKEILREMISDFGGENNKPYRNLETGTLHPAVAAIMKAADVRKSDLPRVIMKIKLPVKCRSISAIEGLYESRDATARLEKAPMPAVRAP